MMRPALPFAALLVLALGACDGGEGPTGPQGPEGPVGPQGPGAPAAASIELTPLSLILGEGFTAELAATVLAADGSPVEGAAVTWTSGDAAVAALSPLTGATVDPTKVLVTGEGHGSATITAMVGSASAEASLSCCFPVASAVAFSVESGTTVTVDQYLGGAFNENTDEAFVEFTLGFGDVPTLAFDFTVEDGQCRTTDTEAAEFSIAVYSANGAGDASDFGAGTSLETLSVEPCDERTASLDVTEAVAALKAGGATHIGFRFHGSTLGYLNLQDGATLNVP